MFSSGTNSGTRIDGVGGVNPQPSALRVTQTGSPSLAVAVDRGICVVPGIENILQGNYCVVNDTAIASVPLALAPHATLFRKDAIVVRVKDAVYSGALNRQRSSASLVTPALLLALRLLPQQQRSATPT